MMDGMAGPMGPQDGFNLTRGILDNHTDGASQARKYAISMAQKKAGRYQQAQQQLSQYSQSQMISKEGADLGDVFDIDVESFWYEDKARAQQRKAERMEVNAQQENNILKGIGGAIIAGKGTKIAMEGMKFMRDDRFQMFNRNAAADPNAVQLDEEYAKPNSKSKEHDVIGKNIAESMRAFNDYESSFANHVSSYKDSKQTAFDSIKDKMSGISMQRFQKANQIPVRSKTPQAEGMSL